MKPCRPPSSSRARLRSRLPIAISLVGLCLPPALLAADQLLRAGTWKGEYEPKDIGQSVAATFLVERGDEDTPPWKVTMHLKLDPPGNAPTPFDDIETKDDALTFSVSIHGARRECVLRERGEDELFGECALEDGTPDKKSTLTMRRPAEEPEDAGPADADRDL